MTEDSDEYDPSSPVYHYTSYNRGVEFCDDCESMMYGENKSWHCPSCGATKPLRNSVKATSETEEAQSDGKQNSKKYEGQGDVEERSTKDPSNDQDGRIENLRREAQESAVEEVSENATITRHQSPEYVRSQKIREYVLARADGICEGCGDPAPFTSKTGKPYLHAHHIHELSNGGSDTPDTVIALCPNCHYRVHHGEDGEEYNTELLKIVRELEQ